MNSNYKKISIDFNYYYISTDKPIISPFVVEHFELKDGDIVIGFQDELEWKGIVRKDSTCPVEMEWFLDVTGCEEYEVTLERMEGREEGARAAIPFGEIRGELYVVTAMLEDGIEIDIVKKYTRLSKTRLENISQNLNRKK